MFERGDGLVQVPLTEAKTADTGIGHDQTGGVIDRLGQPDRFLPLAMPK